jgi:hypothetical protein
VSLIGNLVVSDSGVIAIRDTVLPEAPLIITAVRV